MTLRISGERGAIQHWKGCGFELKPSVKAKILGSISAPVSGSRAFEILKPQSILVMVMNKEFSASFLPGQIRRPYVKFGQLIVPEVAESRGAQDKKEVMLDRLTYPTKCGMSITVRVWFCAILWLWVQVPLWDKGVRVLEIFLIMMYCPEVTHNCSAFRNEMPFVKIVL